MSTLYQNTNTLIELAPQTNHTLIANLLDDKYSLIVGLRIDVYGAGDAPLIHSRTGMRLTFVVPASRLGQQLFVLYWDELQVEWVVLELTDIDPLTGRVSLYVTQTGIYVLGAAE